MRELKQKTTFPISGTLAISPKSGLKASFPFLRGIPEGEGVFAVLTKKVLILLPANNGRERPSELNRSFSPTPSRRIGGLGEAQ